MTPPEPLRRGFAAAWDDYVANSTPPAGAWVGDEWGDEGLWSAWFRRLFEPHGVATWRRAIEVGPGAGKYTERVLAASGATVLALDVSARFQELCRRRLAHHVASGRLRLALVGEHDHDALANAARAEGWQGSVDAVYSIDTLVHLTVHQVTALLLSATAVLAPGGWCVGTFACCTSAPGLDKLVSDINRVLRSGGDPTTGCFHWSSPDAMRAIAAHLGYEVVLCDVDPAHGRDGHLVLRFRDAARAAAARARAAGTTMPA